MVIFDQKNKLRLVEVHDSQVAPELIDLIEKADYFIADKGYDSEEIRNQVWHNSCNIISQLKKYKSRGAMPSKPR
jgi:hypothetical protein